MEVLLALSSVLMDRLLLLATLRLLNRSVGELYPRAEEMTHSVCASLAANGGKLYIVQQIPERQAFFR